MAVFAIIEDMPEGEIPLIQDDYKFGPAKWKFPGGRTEARETPELALYRELEEEIGVVIFPVGDKDVILEIDTETHTFRVYRARHYGGELKPRCDEVKNAHAFPAEEALLLLANEGILPKHAAALRAYFAQRENRSVKEMATAEA